MDGQTAVCCIKNKMRTIVNRPFRLDAGLLHHRAPARLLLTHECGKILRATAFDVGTLVGEALADVGHVQNLDQLGVEPLHDRGRRTAGGGDAVPERDVHFGIAELGERGGIRQEAMALGACGGEHAQLASGDERQQRGHRVEHHGDAAGHQVDHRRAASAIGDVQQIGPRERLEQLSGKVRGAAVAGRRE
jgi:hypothetical protein